MRSNPVKPRPILLGRVFPSGTVFDPATSRPVTSGVKSIQPRGWPLPLQGFVRDPFYTGTVGNTTNFTGAAAEAQMNKLPSTRLNAGAIALLKLSSVTHFRSPDEQLHNQPRRRQRNIDGFDTRFDQVFSE